MSLSITVGVLSALSARADDTTHSHHRDELAAFNHMLRALDLPEHQEPEQWRTCGVWRCDVGRPACIHYLRRIAAHLALTGTVPGPVAGDPARDRLVEQYYAGCRRFALDTRQREVEQLSLPMDTPLPRVEVIDGPGFEHLMWHSDCTGYYLPVLFSQVIVLPEHPRWEWHRWGPWLGSSHALLRECTQLAEALEYPRSMHVEELRQQEPDSTAGDWRRYAIECFVCQAFIAACEASLGSGAAVVFC